VLVLDDTRAPFDAPAVRDLVAAALGPAALLPFVSGMEPLPTLLPWRPTPTPPAPEAAKPAAAVRPLVPTRTCSLAIASDLPAVLGQRLVALLGNVGLRVTVSPVAPEAIGAAEADARVLAFSPEVAEPRLALQELALLGGESPAPATPELDRLEATILRPRVVIPLGRLSLTATSRQGVRGLRFDAAGRLVLEDTWLRP
jgi:hypothetical protein